jgi:hypothetical protein
VVEAMRCMRCGFGSWNEMRGRERRDMRKSTQIYILVDQTLVCIGLRIFPTFESIILDVQLVYGVLRNSTALQPLFIVRD